MGCLGNVLWFVFGGAVSGLSWCLAGCLWCITVVGIALFFRQSTDCFKKQLWRDFLPGFLKDGFGGFTFEIFIKRMKLPRFV